MRKDETEEVENMVCCETTLHFRHKCLPCIKYVILSTVVTEMSLLIPDRDHLLVQWVVNLNQWIMKLILMKTLIFRKRIQKMIINHPGTVYQNDGCSAAQSSNINTN